jgi:glucokinase
MILSLDIGGSKIASGLVKNNKVFNFQKTAWQKPLTAQKIVNQISQIILDYRLKISHFSAIAVGMAGQVNGKGEVFVTRHLLVKETKINLKVILEKKFKLPVYVDNDAHCFALGEAIFGQAKKKKIVVGLTIGSGIGGGIIFDKKIYHGQSGYPAEFGHMIINPKGEKCSCGKHGCWEAYASGYGIKSFYHKITGKKKNSFEIAEEFRRKDKSAVLTIKRAAYFLAIGLANIINILDPEIIILGGGLARFQGLINLALKQVKQWLAVSDYQTKILVSSHPEKIALLGASLLAREQLNN